MCRLMRFYAGGVSQRDMMDMPLTEFFELIMESKEVAGAEKREIERARSGK
jgi:hypothetical protein